MARHSERSTRVFIYAFVCFFLALAVVVVAMVVMEPEGVNFGNSGLILLLSVIGGGLFGALVGTIELPRVEPGEIIWADELWDRDLDS